MAWRNCITVGRAYDLVREDLLAHLRRAQKEIGFNYCRFHALFHDDMGVVKRRAGGELSFHWHHVDKIYDALLGMQLRPFVELNGMPRAMASGTTTVFQYAMNITPPSDYAEWGLLVSEFAKHVVDRYGLDEVRKWYFEVWNEPNLDCFWTGDQAGYFRLYETAARALKGVDAGLRVGGPATAMAAWVPETISYCTKHGVPLDFVSTHVYPHDEQVHYDKRANSPFPKGRFVNEHVEKVHRQVRESARPDLEIHWTEWNGQTALDKASVTFMNNRYLDTPYAAALIAKLAVEFDGITDSFAWWVLSDIFEEHPIPSAPFSCTYGAVTIHGIPKASYNAFKLLARLRGNRLEATAAGEAPEGCGLVGTRELATSQVLLWNHHFVEDPARPAWRDSVQIPVVESREHVVTVTTIRAGKGSARETWEEMGRPVNLSRAQEAMIRDHAEPGYAFLRLTPQYGVVVVPFELGSNEVVHLECRPAEMAALPKDQESSLTLLESQLGDMVKQ